MSPGKKLIASLDAFLRDVEAGKPVRQTIVRRMKVRGETVYARETYAAPLKKGGAK